MELSTVEKIKLTMGRKGMNITKLSEAVGMSRQNLTNKLSRGDLKQSDLEKIAEALECDLIIDFKERP